MNEKLLQYLWNFKLFSHFDFKDAEGNPLEIIDSGRWNSDSGPDFLLAKIKWDGVTLAGNIELHVKSSDWIFHRHSGNPEFANIILHVVYINDVEIEEFTRRKIPTLELKDYIDPKLLEKYGQLLKETQFIPCEDLLQREYLPPFFHEQNLLKKLDLKAEEIQQALHRTKNNYEEVLFHQLAYTFGLKINAPVFRHLAESIDYSIVNRIRHNLTQLEALLFGCCNWLDNPLDEQMKIWNREFRFLKSKYRLTAIHAAPKFSRLRPPGFPTLRLAQLASLYHQNQNLFSKLIGAKNTEELYQLFSEVKAGVYWNSRFSFAKESQVCYEKKLSRDFMDLIIINAVLPIKYTFHRNMDENAADHVLNFYQELSPEKNTLISKWRKLHIPPKNALESQSLIYQYQHLCQRKDCLQCPVGLRLLNT